MSNHRYSKFWWQDWHSEPCLEMCSLAARGLWMELLCLAHAGTPYGHVTVAGENPTLQALARYARTTEREVRTLLGELEKHRVFDRTNDGVIVSRRMVRDGERSEEGAKAVAKRWGSGNGGTPPKGTPNRPPSDSTYKDTSYSIDQKQKQRSEADAGARGGAAPRKVFNLVFPDDPGRPEPPAPRPAWGSTGHRLESTAKREPYGAVRSVEEQRAIILGEKAG